MSTDLCRISPGARSVIDVITGDGRATGYLEFRVRSSSGTWRQSFVSLERQSAWQADIQRIATRADVYVGCIPRSRPSGRRDAVYAGWTLWADCDGPAAVAALESFPVAPSVVVGSGTADNRHAYWGLRGSLPASVIEHANRRLALTLGSDAAVTHANAILRPPGTLNHKITPPSAVTLMHETAVRRELADVLSVCRMASPEHDNAPPERTHRAGLQSISPDEYVRVLLATEVPRNRKVRCPGAHEDRTPSLHVYPRPERGWFCFGCRRGGTIYDLAGLAWGLSTRGADFVELQRRLRALWPHAAETPHHAGG